MGNTVHEHRGNKASVVSLFAGHAMMNHQSLPLRKNTSVSASTTKRYLRFSNSTFARSTLQPKPLLAMGRVATAQNSIRFCGKIESVSPWLRSASNPSLTTGWAACPSSMLRSKTFVSTAKLTIGHLLSRDKCFHGRLLHLIAVGVQASRYAPIQGKLFSTPLELRSKRNSHRHSSPLFPGH